MHKTEARAFAVEFDRDEPLIVLGADLVHDAVRAGLIGVALEFVAAIGAFFGFLFEFAPPAMLIPLLTAILLMSAFKVWRHE